MDPAPATSTAWLARFVEEVRVVASVPGRALPLRRLPDGRTILIVRGLAGGTGDVSVSGPRSRALFKHATGVERVVIVQFKPGWSAPIFGVGASALTDRIVPLQDLWGGASGDLCRELVATRRTPELLARLTHALAGRAAEMREPASARLARRAVRLLETDEIRVERVAARLGVSARHLRRAFRDHVGIGPKDFARTVRLQRAVRSTTTSTDWSRIAADAGYYDQAHLIGEFRDLVGLTPGAFLKQAI